jgi:hypothetical protein
MKNKKLLYGAVLVAGLVGLYLWNKNKTTEKCNCSGGVTKPEENPSANTYSSMSGY